LEEQSLQPEAAREKIITAEIGTYRQGKNSEMVRVYLVDRLWQTAEAHHALRDEYREIKAV